MARFWRLLVLMLVIVLGVLAASWYFAGRDETDGAESVPGVVGREPDAADITASGGEAQTKTTVVTTFGTQTTVPDVVGQDEATATFTVEEGGFRVRVTNRTVPDPSEEGIVVQQLPRGGVTRRTESTVTLVVGRLH